MNIMNMFSKPNPPFVSWADADRYREAGYQPLAVELWRADAGHETPSDGPWAFGPPGPAAPERNTVGILGARLPRPNSNDSILE